MILTFNLSWFELWPDLLTCPILLLKFQFVEGPNFLYARIHDVKVA